MQSQDQSQPPRSIWRISIRGLSEQAKSELLSKMPIHEGSVLSEQLLQEALQLAKMVDPRLEVFVNKAPGPEASHDIPPKLRDKLGPLPHGNAVNVTFYDPAKVPQRIKVEARVQDSMSIEKAMPVCSDAHVTGVVQLAVIVGKDGTVTKINPIAGPERLVEAAVDAVKHWKYRPTLLNGLPVEVQTTVDVSFASTQ